MDHITKYHTSTLFRKSTFVRGVDVDTLIRWTVMHPLLKKQHTTKKHCYWYFGKYKSVIGFRSIDGAPCQWIAVLLDKEYLITACPVPHPMTVSFMH